MKKNLLALFRQVSEILSPLPLTMLTVAGIVNAFGVLLFLTPVMIYDSGISGTSMLFAQLTGLPLSVFLILLNYLFWLGLLSVWLHPSLCLK